MNALVPAVSSTGALALRNVEVPLIAPNKASRVMLWSIAGFTVALIGWAALAEVNETAMAQGRVIPSRQLQVVSNLEGGVVKDILVRPGQHVTAGQLLVRLDPRTAGADLGRGSATTDALAARLARLQAEVAGAAPVFPVELETRSPAAVAAERAIFSARQADISAQTAAERAKAEAASRMLAEAENELAVRREARAQASREADLIAPLVDKGIEPRISLDRARSAVAQATAQEAGSGEAVRRARAGVAEAFAALRAVEGKFRSQTGDQLAAARLELAGQNAALPALQDRMARTEVRAPVAGIVNRVMVATVGGTVRPGEPLVEVVPGGDRLVIDARVRPQDIAFVHPGQPATVKLTAYDASVYGSLAGHVERISPDAVVNERTGESYFEVRVTTDKAALTAPDGMKLPVGAGMVAEVDLLGHKRSVLSYLLSPVTKLKDNAFREK